MSLLTMSSPDSSTADGSLNSSSNTPGSSSKRRAKLIGDLEAGAKLVESLDKSDDVYSRFLEETSSEPSTDGGDIACLSSGGEASFSRIASSDSQVCARRLVLSVDTHDIADIMRLVVSGLSFRRFLLRMAVSTFSSARLHVSTIRSLPCALAARVCVGWHREPTSVLSP